MITHEVTITYLRMSIFLDRPALARLDRILLIYPPVFQNRDLEMSTMLFSVWARDLQDIFCLSSLQDHFQSGGLNGKKSNPPSVGGEKRVWCQKQADPPSLYRAKARFALR